MPDKPPKKFFFLCLLLAALFFALAYYLNAAHPLTEITTAAISEWRYWSRITNGLMIASFIFVLIPCLWIMFMLFKQAYDNE